MMLRCVLLTFAFCLPLQALASFAAADQPPAPYGVEARQVMAYVQKTFWDKKSHLYVRSATDRRPDYIWREAAAFSALVGAARHEPKLYRPLMAQHFAALNSYWDTKAPIPAYEPSPTLGNGHDKYL